MSYTYKECPNCKKRFELDDSFCDECGSGLVIKEYAPRYNQSAGSNRNSNYERQPIPQENHKSNSKILITAVVIIVIDIIILAGIAAFYNKEKAAEQPSETSVSVTTQA